MSIIVGLSLAIACAAFALGLLVGSGRKSPRTVAVFKPRPEWTCTFEAMKQTDRLGSILGDAVFGRLAMITNRTNSHGTPHIDEEEVDALCAVVLDHALNTIQGYGIPREAPQ